MNLRDQVIIKVTLCSCNQNTIYTTLNRKDYICSVKERLEKYSGIPVNDQILYQVGHLISDDICLEEIIEANYRGIIEMNLDIAIMGGADNMEPIDAPDMTSEDCFEEIDFAKSAPDYMIISKGINFGGICRNLNCIAHDKFVCIQLKMCEESNNICNYSEYMFELKCPACECFIETNDIRKVFFLGCSVTIKFKKVKDSRPKEFEMVAKSNRFLTLKDGQDILRYNYIKFTLK